MALPKKVFTLKESHIHLLSCMFVDWTHDEFGAPCIDPKRPYGNGDVLIDMARILGIEIDKDEDGCDAVSFDVASDLEALHFELETALQVVLRTKSFVPGRYECEPYSGDIWELVT